MNTAWSPLRLTSLPPPQAEREAVAWGGGWQRAFEPGAHVYIIYNIYIYLYNSLCNICHRISLGPGRGNVTLRKHAETGRESGSSPDLEDEHGLCGRGRGKGRKHIHHVSLLNARIRRKGGRAQAEGEEWEIWVFLNKQLKIKVHPPPAPKKII